MRKSIIKKQTLIKFLLPASCFLLLFCFVCVPTNVSHAYQPAVVSASPEASKIGLEILKKGGSAADAAIATAFALSVLEPQNSGLGGGGFLLYYEASSQKFFFVDYREASPQKTSFEFFQKNPKALEEGILSVGVPGFLLGMETIHKQWRKVSWPALLEPAIDLAKRGAPFEQKIKEKIEERLSLLSADVGANDLLVKPYQNQLGKMNQADLAATLENIKTGGSQIFYRGEIAKKIISFMKARGGLITSADLAAYQVYFRKPYTFDYEKYSIISSPLPSSGGKGLELLFRRAIIGSFEKSSPYSPEAFQLILEALKSYLAYREVALGDTMSNLVSHTSHLCVIDKEGNMASMTNTLNSPFGAGVVVPGTGIILNNEMGDFSLNSKSPNRVRPQTRPLSSMAPTIVFEKGSPRLIIGTPGGLTIPQNLFQVLLFTWDWKATPAGAIAAPKIYFDPKTDQVVLETKISKKIVETLEQDQTVTRKPSVGNVQALLIRDENHTLPVSDPRGEGKGFTLR